MRYWTRVNVPEVRNCFVINETDLQLKPFYNLNLSYEGAY